MRVGPYDGAVGQMIRRYKYERQQQLDRILGSLLAAVIGAQPWGRDLDALVPVPASLRERLFYRFFPVGQMATKAGEKLGLPALPLLQVQGKRRRQTEMTPSQRAANVRSKFHVSRHARISGARLCIVDDVTTSGATLHETARALKRAGASSVYGVVLAKAGYAELHASEVVEVGDESMPAN